MPTRTLNVREELDGASNFSYGPSSQNPHQNPRTVHERGPNTVRSIPSESKSKCSISRLILAQLLVLVGLLALAAIVIPIVVIVLDTRSTTSCATTYSQSFTNAMYGAAQCAAWQTFTNGLTCASYSTMRIYGSNDQTGISVTDPLVATTLAVALRQNTTITIISNGVTWRVWPCSSTMEITSTGNPCSCSTGYTVRPCWNPVAGYWGGILSNPCSSASQTMSISFT